MSKTSLTQSDEKIKEKMRRVESPPKAVYMTRSKEEEEFSLWARVPTFKKSVPAEFALGQSSRVQEKAVVDEIRPIYDSGKVLVKKKIKIKNPKKGKAKDYEDAEEPDEIEIEIDEEIEIDPDFIEREALMVDTSPFEREMTKPVLGYRYVVPYPDTSLIDVALRDDLKLLDRETDRFSELPGHPNVSDPGTEEAFLALGGTPTDFRDNVGEKHYRYMCKQLNVIPSMHFIRQLKTDYASFRYYGLDPRAIRPITEALSRNTYVKYLDLEDNWLTYDSACHLADLFRENETIKGLNLTGCRLGPQSAWKLSELMTVTRSLEELLLSNNNLGNKGVVALVDGVTTNNSIQTLDLSRNHLGTAAAMAIGPTFEDNWTLRHLDLSWNSLFDKDGFKKLADGLILNTGIEHLNLTGNALGIEVMKSLRTIINKNKTLKNLDLSFNRINDKCLAQIRKAVAKNENLDIIRFANNPITYTATSALLAAFQRFNTSKLQLLDLEDIWVDKKFMQIEKEIKKERLFETINAGIVSNYELHKLDEMELLMKRAYFEGMSPKKKKKKRDFGHFLLKAPAKPMTPKTFNTKIKEEKLKIVPTLLDELSRRYMTPKGKVDVQGMKERYLQYFPDTALPPPKEKKKKGKKGKGKKGKKEDAAADAGAAPPPESAAEAQEAPEAAAAAAAAPQGSPSTVRISLLADSSSARVPTTRASLARRSSLPAPRPSQLIPRASVNVEKRQSTMMVK